MPEITFHVNDDLHKKYKQQSKAIKSLGIDINRTVPFFLIDHLEAEAKKHFSNIKKIWQRNASKIL